MFSVAKANGPARHRPRSPERSLAHAYIDVEFEGRGVALDHSALQVRVPEGRYVIEMAWPIPDSDGAFRGVVVEGPVGSHALERFRPFRYEVRRWQDGVIPDILEAVASPQRLSNDLDRAQSVLDLVGSVPTLVWGRDELGMGDMWNSNSVVSWLLARSGLPMDGIQPPVGGRAPGWDVGILTARRPDGLTLTSRQQATCVSVTGTPGPPL